MSYSLEGRLIFSTTHRGKKTFTVSKSHDIFALCLSHLIHVQNIIRCHSVILFPSIWCDLSIQCTTKYLPEILRRKKDYYHGCLWRGNAKRQLRISNHALSYFAWKIRAPAPSGLISDISNSPKYLRVSLIGIHIRQQPVSLSCSNETNVVYNNAIYVQC